MDQLMGWIVNTNSTRARAADRCPHNPVPLAGIGWNASLEERFPAIRAEWDAFAGAGGRLPRIEQILAEHQGNEGSWRAGLLLSRGRAVRPFADRFPATIEALSLIPGLLYATFSVLEPGAELHEHCGPNAGVLRYHLTLASNDHAAVRVNTTTLPYVEGRGVLFDDTAPHAAWNHGDTDRVSILCELLRPIPAPASWMNHAVQSMISRDRRYRLAATRAAEWDRVLNPAGA